jgi:hypothetical protein
MESKEVTLIEADNTILQHGQMMWSVEVQWEDIGQNI